MHTLENDDSCHESSLEGASDDHDFSKVEGEDARDEPADGDQESGQERQDATDNEPPQSASPLVSCSSRGEICR